MATTEEEGAMMDEVRYPLAIKRKVLRGEVVDAPIWGLGDWVRMGASLADGIAGGMYVVVDSTVKIAKGGREGQP